MVSQKKKIYKCCGFSTSSVGSYQPCIQIDIDMDPPN